MTLAQLLGQIARRDPARTEATLVAFTELARTFMSYGKNERHFDKHMATPASAIRSGG